jgi:hypothetical protein
MSIRRRLERLEKTMPVQEDVAKEQPASRRYLNFVGLLLRHFEKAPLDKVPAEERAGWPRALEIMRQSLALVAEYVESGMTGSYTEYHCNGTLMALGTWLRPPRDGIGRRFPFSDGQCPPGWGIPNNEVEHLQQCRQLDRSQQGT